MSEFKVGDEVKVTKLSDGFTWETSISDVNGSSYKFDKWYTGFEGACWWDNGTYVSIELINEEKPQMEVTRENLSDKKVYVTLADNWFPAGTAVSLSYNDETCSPKFKKLNTSDEAYIALFNLKEFGAEEEKTEPEVTEVTLEEIASKFDIDVAQLRIKE